MIRRGADLTRIERERDAVVSTIVAASVRPEQQTFVMSVIAEAFFDRLLEAFDRASYRDLVAWLEATCDRHANLPQVAPMLASAPRAIVACAHAYGLASPELEAELLALEPSIGAIAFTSRRRPAAGDELPDEASRPIHDLLQQMEANDPLTFEHSHAVSLWCSRIARRMSLSERDVAHTARSGLVHDLGKMNIPIAILHAPRPLTAEEWTVVRTHPALGEEIVRDRATLRPFAATIRSHHERLDGRGYPDGLGAAQISLTTRIVTVADAFNAMIGRRPYRLPMSPENALGQLHAHRGTQFDPLVVEAMIDIVSHPEPH